MKTHQPFLFYNENNQVNLLLCKSNSKITLHYGNDYELDYWRIYLNENGTETNLKLIDQDVEFGDVVVECNPHVFYKNNERYIGYNAGFCKGTNEPVIYRYVHGKLAYIDDRLAMTDHVIGDVCFNGFMTENDFYKIQRSEEIHLNDLIAKNGVPLNIQLDMLFLYRINPIFNDANHFIATFEDNSFKMQSWLITTDGVPVKEIKNQNNESLYKCSALDSMLAYSSKTEEDVQITLEILSA